MPSPAWLDALVSSGHIADIAIACLIAECLWLLNRPGAVGRRAFYVFNAGSGICLMLALRVALTNAAPLAIAACLSASFILHLLELRSRP